MPLPMVAFPWGSRSMSRTRRRVAAREAARLTAVVVLPTPPFWLATAMTRFMAASVHRRGSTPISRYRRDRLSARGCTLQRPRARRSRSLSRSRGQPLPGHLIGDGAGRPRLAAGALEDLAEPRGNPLDLRLHLGLCGVTAIFMSNADDAACIDHV